MDGSLDTLCGLPSADGATISQTDLAAFEGCVSGAPAAGVDCVGAFEAFMHATGCAGCLDELQQQEMRSVVFCSGLGAGECAQHEAPCDGADGALGGMLPHGADADYHHHDSQHDDDYPHFGDTGSGATGRVPVAVRLTLAWVQSRSGAVAHRTRIAVQVAPAAVTASPCAR